MKPMKQPSIIVYFSHMVYFTNRKDKSKTYETGNSQNENEANIGEPTCKCKANYNKSIHR